jgi:hypothetical protein
MAKASPELKGVCQFKLFKMRSSVIGGGNRTGFIEKESQ